MSEVWKARDSRLDRIVAIKILPEPFASDPQFRDRFEREARAVSALDHPNICSLYDVGEAPNPESPSPNPTPVRYLVMQYLEGETLQERLDSTVKSRGSSLRSQVSGAQGPGLSSSDDESG